MTPEHEIGRVVAVDTAQVTVELVRELKALTRSTYEGALDVGRINSYIIMPVGSRQIVAMVTRVVMSEDQDTESDPAMVSLPSSRRLMKATMIGSIDEGCFRQGISIFPVLDSKVFLTSRADLDAIFGRSSRQQVDLDKPGYCIAIGRSAVFNDYSVCIDPDAFFGKHAAVIGSTGSGKSCTIATIIQSILSRPDVLRTRFVILDTNGEYRSAFQQHTGGTQYDEAQANRKTLYVPTGPGDAGRLTIPYWFMNSDDFVRLFRASPGVQRPVLLNALGAARVAELAQAAWTRVRDNVIRESNRILGLASGSDAREAKTIRQLCDEMAAYLNSPTVTGVSVDFNAKYPELTIAAIRTAFATVQAISREGIKNENGQYESYAPIGAQKRQRIEDTLRPVLGHLGRLPPGDDGISTSTADAPSYFSKQRFRYEHLERAVSGEDTHSGRARDNSSTMLMRIYRLLEDNRFEFLFGPRTAEWPAVRHALAAFLRDILGLASAPAGNLTGEPNLATGLLPYYDRQRAGAVPSNVVIVDLSLLASEVLENVTALLGRLIHEFLQRLSDPVSGIGRGEFPVVLVLEEAQNYIREGSKTEEESISKMVFERIAREGRKYGLSLVVASQRPSELSKTVLSQCNSFVVHRLQNPEDLRYFREIVPGIYGQLLSQLPALAPRHALILGECVQAPVLVEIREVNPAPRSKDPKFFKSWAGPIVEPNVEAVCAKWEGGPEADDNPADIVEL